MVKKLMVFMLAFFIISGLEKTENKQKYVIGTEKGWGFFGAFFQAIISLTWCEEHDRIPVVYWDSESPYHNDEPYNGTTNAWEYYFEPVSSAVYQEGDQINRVISSPLKDLTISLFFNKACFSQEGQAEREAAHKAVAKYVRVKPRILEAVNHFYNKNMAHKKTIGIHLRGTDKHTEFRSAPPLTLLAKANELNCDQYLVATDECALLELAQKKLNKPVICYNAERSLDGSPIHIGKTNGARAGEEVLIEMLLLSRCELLIHTCSNVSMAVLCFNPSIQNILFPPL